MAFNLTYLKLKFQIMYLWWNSQDILSPCTCTRKNLQMFTIFRLTNLIKEMRPISFNESSISLRDVTFCDFFLSTPIERNNLIWFSRSTSLICSFEASYLLQDFINISYLTAKYCVLSVLKKSCQNWSVKCVLWFPKYLRNDISHDLKLHL